MSSEERATGLGILDILRILPHRYPFLLVDRILEVEPGKKVVGLKNVTFNEEFFQGHFPGNPVMPGVLLIEAMAQVGAFMLIAATDGPRRRQLRLAGLDAVRFRRPVVPETRSSSPSSSWPRRGRSSRSAARRVWKGTSAPRRRS